jgi:hypothetical protein
MNKTTSLFSQLLKQIPRLEFESLVKKHGSERHARGFNSWTQLVAMLFCQLAKADSLREICQGLKSSSGKLLHLGVTQSPNKSTLSYANQNRSAGLFEDLFWKLLEQYRTSGSLGQKQHKFRFKNKLLSFDSTTISLCLNLFPWAKFRRAKGGVKAHVMLDHDDYMPSYVLITEARTHDSKVLKNLELKANSIIVMDRAYNDYQQFSNWNEQGVFFVTRMKDNAVYRTIKNNPIPKNRKILSDKLIRLSGSSAKAKCPHQLRRIVVWDETKEKELVILTNHLEFGATTIADIYKARWQIELFFKSLKQNLKIKTFIGVSENALRIQIWTALITMLLLKWLHHMSKAGLSFANIVTLVRLNLFSYRDLFKWLDNPFDTPAYTPPSTQMCFQWD